VARQALQAALEGSADPVEGPAAVPDALRRPGRAFVTLRHDGELRGCIGQIDADRSLAEAVWRAAVLAATDDPRFSPLAREELEGLRLEVSVLTEPLRMGVADLAGVEPGRDGVMVRRGRRQGILLPQVATEQGWDAMALLAAVCRKAGLPDDAWRRPDCELYVFRADVFGE
jgi:AmmeMemoRadiSam system protein A